MIIELLTSWWRREASVWAPRRQTPVSSSPSTWRRNSFIVFDGNLVEMYEKKTWCITRAATVRRAGRPQPKLCKNGDLVSSTCKRDIWRCKKVQNCAKKDSFSCKWSKKVWLKVQDCYSLIATLGSRAQRTIMAQEAVVRAHLAREFLRTIKTNDKTKLKNKQNNKTNKAPCESVCWEQLRQTTKQNTRANKTTKQKNEQSTETYKTTKSTKQTTHQHKQNTNKFLSAYQRAAAKEEK